MANCENCPVTKSEDNCDKKPYNPRTCFKKVNRVREPKMSWVKFLKKVYNADEGSILSIHGLDELLEKAPPSPNSLLGQLSSGKWRDNEFIADVRTEKNLTDDSFEGFTVEFTDGKTRYIDKERLVETMFNE